MSRKSLKINDISKASPILTKVDNEDLMPLPWDIKEKEPKEIADGLKEDYACILDDVCVLNIPRPKTIVAK